MKSINKQATECEQGCSTQTCNNILPKNVCFPTKHRERKKKTEKYDTYMEKEAGNRNG